MNDELWVIAAFASGVGCAIVLAAIAFVVFLGLVYPFDL